MHKTRNTQILNAKDQLDQFRQLRKTVNLEISDTSLLQQHLINQVRILIYQGNKQNHRSYTSKYPHASHHTLNQLGSIINELEDLTLRKDMTLAHFFDQFQVLVNQLVLTPAEKIFQEMLYKLHQQCTHEESQKNLLQQLREQGGVEPFHYFRF